VVEHPAHARRLIGMVPQFNTLDRSLTVFENLYYHCATSASRTGRQNPAPWNCWRQFLLSERKGMYPRNVRRAGAAGADCRAIAHRPTVLFLDEPSAGLTRRAAWRCGRRSRVAQGRHYGIADHALYEGGRHSSATAWRSSTMAACWRSDRRRS